MTVEQPSPGLTADLIFWHRLAQAADAPALAALTNDSPVGGNIGFTYEYQADMLAVSRALANDVRAGVALAGERVIGMIFGDFAPVQWSGAVCPGVYVSNLHVHPDYQRRGAARGLADWGLAYIEAQLRGQAVIYAAITEGNTSISLARRYGLQATQPVQGGVIPVRRTPPASLAGLEVRPGTTADLPAFAAGVNDFYRQHNLWNPVTPLLLQEMLEREVAGVRPNQLYVVTRGGEVVGGCSVSDRTRLVRMRVTRAAPYVRLLGSLLGVLPREGVLRALTIRQVWFRDGDVEAGRYLWHTLRYLLRERGNCLGIAYDLRDRLAEVFHLPFWLPMVKARYLVRAAAPLQVERLTYCIAGA